MSHDSTPRQIADDVRALGLALSQLTGAAARGLGVSVPELLTLRLLDEGAGLGPSDLARRLQLTTGTVTALVDRLEAQGRVVRTPHPGDRRRVVVRRTPRAAADLHREEACFLAGIAALAADFSDEERRILATFLERSTDIIERTADEARAA